MNISESYKSFLKNGKTERECTSEIIRLAQEKGYVDINKVSRLKAGDKVYVAKWNKSIALFHVGSLPMENGMNILGAHIDSPRLDIKQNPLYESDFIVYLNTHYYGGIKKYQWVTIPLALHGVVCLKDGTTVKISIGEDPDDPVFCISDILPHLAQKQMEGNAKEFIPGEDLDIICGSGIVDSGDDKEKESAKKNILELLKDKYGMEEKDFNSAELEVVPAGAPRDLGFDRSLILAYGQDDRSCAYTSVQAILDTEKTEKTLCCLCVDKEEIGSVGATGMASHFMENAVAEVIARLEDYSDLTLRRCLNNSIMLSSDVNSAYDPLNTGLYDKKNSSFLGGGIVFNKYTGSRGKSGASDADPEFIARLRNALDNADIKYQLAELGKVDQGGGGTIAYLAAKYGMYVLDAGVSVLSMHAPWEITSKFDIEEAYRAYREFLKFV
ncbi:MAG: aminopeptidase [Spirochaetia bacterium]|uniref:aminopeptidase n=1 Tax=Treponema sp. TaxID=166 RepID=UPI00298EB7DC|nr:aminopeptidase [Treponema sp.]MCI7576719.1 aminopeptidase [Spirochaetia bacterium]